MGEIILNRTPPKYQLFLIAMGGILSGLILLECVLRIIAPIKYHEWMEWIADGHIKGRGWPNSEFKNASGNTIHINEFGFRGPTPSFSAKPGTFRILTLGGSSTFGYHAHGEEKTWPQQLASQLSAKFETPIEVINLALPGFDSQTSSINFQVTGRLLRPDAVIVYHTWNDLKFFRLFPNRLKDVVFASTVDNKPLWQQVARNSQIAIRLRNFFLELSMTKRENFYTSLEHEGDLANTPVTDDAIRWFRNNFADISQLVLREDAIPILVSQASLAHSESISDPAIRRVIENDYVGMTLPILIDTWQRVNVEISNVSHDYGAIFVDAYNSIPPSFDYLEDHVHLTDEGNALLASTIKNTLVSDTRFRERIRKKQSLNSAVFDP